MKAHIIINPNRAVPNTTLQGELTTQNIVPEYWEAIPDANNVVRSINLSHKQIVKFAKEYYLPKICIMEEDVMFTHHDAFAHFLLHIPDYFDLYLGGAYGLNQMALNRLKKEQDTATPEIHNFRGLHCYIIHENFYDRFLDTPEDRHIDDQPGRGVFKVLYPFVALQHPGWSSNARKEQNYNEYLHKNDLYAG